MGWAMSIDGPAVRPASQRGHVARGEQKDRSVGAEVAEPVQRGIVGISALEDEIQSMGELLQLAALCVSHGAPHWRVGVVDCVAAAGAALGALVAICASSVVVRRYRNV